MRTKKQQLQSANRLVDLIDERDEQMFKWRIEISQLEKELKSHNPDLETFHGRTLGWILSGRLTRQLALRDRLKAGHRPLAPRI